MLLLITRVQPKEKAKVIKKCLENIKGRDSKRFIQRNKSRELDSYCARVYDKYALKINKLPSLKSLVDNLTNEKKCLSLGNRFILCKNIGDASVRIVQDNDLISKAFSSLF